MTARHVHVLLVEDDEGLRPILARHLAAKGFRVAEAASAEDATAQLADGLRPASCCWTSTCPATPGGTSCASGALAAAGSPARRGDDRDTVNPRRLREFAVAGYLPKPFAMETLVATVERFVGARP